MQARSTWIVAGVAVIAVLAVAAVIGIFWSELGASNISIAGWLALGFGAIATLALGFGLMTLMFISNREGYDDRAHRDHC
jgi:hypothetical protein